MGLFKSKQEREMEQRILIKRTTNRINKHINELDKQKDKYIEAAKKAKLEGLDGQYSLALSGLKMVLTQQKRAKEMLLNFELTAQMKDLTQVTAGFLQGMGQLSKEMSKTANNMNFAKVQKEFESAMMGVERTQEQLEVMLESSDASFSTVASSSNSVEDKELDSFINAQIEGETAASGEVSIDKQIDQAMNDLMNQIKE